MRTSSKTLIDLETRFWQAIVNQDPDTAVSLLSEPALMVSTHGAVKFDHAGYRKMAEQGSQVLTSFEFSEVEVLFPTDTTAVLSYKVKQEVAPRGKGKGTVQEMADTSTWVQADDEKWRCVMHTETPVETKRAPTH